MASRQKERIAALEARLAELKKREQDIERRRRHVAAKLNRRDEVRRMMVIGEAVLKRFDAGQPLPDAIRVLLDKELTRADDREYFGLEPR